jgi:amino acid adenylation domain-containing protein
VSVRAPSVEKFVSNRLLHAPFFFQAEQFPERVAIVWGNKSIRYGELAAWVATIEPRLIELNIRPDDLIAIHGGREPAFIAAMLAILRIGGAYVPLDHTLPTERIVGILDDAGPKVVLSTSPTAPVELSANGRSVVTIPSAPPVTRTAAQDQPSHIPSATDLAYVIFTSGSTGRPKGVMIEHQGPTNTIQDLNERFGINASDRVLALSSFGFDLSVYDVFGILAAGGTIVLPTDAQVRDPAAWASLIRRHKVTIWNTVPALMEMMVTYAEANTGDLLDSLRLVWLSGDWIPVKLPDRIRKLNSRAQIISMGGATEASIWSVLYPIENVDPDWKSIPYGQAMRGQTINVLHEDLSLCSVGEQGEIHIGGIGLARGYWNQSEVTAARFVPDSRDATGTTRLYRTGDFGRLLPCGNIEFLGRCDMQVKINGNRVGLAEIEAVLNRHPQIRESVVTAPSDRTGRRHLVAYLVGHSALPDRNAQQQFERELRAALKKSLPEYMIPARYQWLDQFPLSDNGKVDRKKLPLPDVFRGEHAPQSKPVLHDASEARLAAIWKKVLPVDDVGSDDHFFDLGGDSMTSAMAISLIEREFSVPLSPIDLAEAPTLSRMIERICSRSSSVAKSASVAAVASDSPWIEIRERGGQTPLVFLPCLFGSLFPIHALAGKLPDEIGVTCLLPRGLANPTEEPDGTIEAMAQYAAERITQRFPNQPLRLVGYSLGGTIAVETVRLLQKRNRSVEFLALIDAPARARPGWVQWLQSWRNSENGDVMSRANDRDGDRSTPYSRHVHRLACESYRPRRLEYPAMIFRARHARGQLAGLIDGWFRRWDWSDLLAVDGNLQWLPSNHDTIFQGESLDVLAKALHSRLCPKTDDGTFVTSDTTSLATVTVSAGCNA